MISIFLFAKSVTANDNTCSSYVDYWQKQIVLAENINKMSKKERDNTPEVFLRMKRNYPISSKNINILRSSKSICKVRDYIKDNCKYCFDWPIKLENFPTKKKKTSNFDIKGIWIGEASNGIIIKYVFGIGKKVTWIVEEPNFMQAFPNGLVGRYQVTTAEPYYYIDINRFEHEAYKNIYFSGIFKIIHRKKIKLEGQPNTMGFRPKSFSSKAIVFSLMD